VTSGAYILYIVQVVNLKDFHILNMPFRSAEGISNGLDGGKSVLLSRHGQVLQSAFAQPFVHPDDTHPQEIDSHCAHSLLELIKGTTEVNQMSFICHYLLQL
jgi:hypothetical protein